MLAANLSHSYMKTFFKELLIIDIYLTVRIFVMFRKKQGNQNPFEILFLTIIWQFWLGLICFFQDKACSEAAMKERHTGHRWYYMKTHFLNFYNKTESKTIYFHRFFQFFSPENLVLNLINSTCPLHKSVFILSVNKTSAHVILNTSTVSASHI